MDRISQHQEGGENAELYQSGRDQTIIKYIIEKSPPIATSALKKLIEAYRIEAKSADQSSTAQYVEKLNFFMNAIDGEFTTLEEKLTAGGFEADVSLALRLKQNYSMALQQIKHISSAQKIHAYLLGLILVNFSNVYEFLHKKADRPDNIFIREIINQNVVAPIENLLNSTENDLELYSFEIYSMIYYLTGNCHIKWN